MRASAFSYWETMCLLGVLLAALIAAVGGQLEITDPEDGQQIVPPGGMATFRCVSTDGADLIWMHQGMQVSNGGRLNIIHTTEGGVTTSTLTIVEVVDRDSGPYRCKQSDDIFDAGGVTKYLRVSQTAATDIMIDGPSEVTVVQDLDLNLKCDAASGSDDLVWKRNGVQLHDEEYGVTITVSRDYYTQRRKALMSRSRMDRNKAGNYQCYDSSTGKSASVTVRVASRGTQGGNIEILEPLSNRHKLDAGSSIVIKCKHDLGTDVTWYKGNLLIRPNTENGFMTATTTEDGFEMSLLTKDKATIDDSGDYRCQNSHLSSDYEAISIIVEEMGGTMSDIGEAHRVTPTGYDTMGGAVVAPTGYDTMGGAVVAGIGPSLTPTLAAITMATMFVIWAVFI